MKTANYQNSQRVRRTSGHASWACSTIFRWQKTPLHVECCLRSSICILHCTSWEQGIHSAKLCLCTSIHCFWWISLLLHTKYSRSTCVSLYVVSWQASEKLIWILCKRPPDWCWFLCMWHFELGLECGHGLQLPHAEAWEHMDWTWRYSTHCMENGPGSGFAVWNGMVCCGCNYGWSWE